MSESTESYETVHLFLKMALLLSIVCLAIFTVMELDEIIKAFFQFIKWVSKNPSKGPLAILGVYVLAETLFMPRSLLSIAVGYSLR